MKLEREEVVIDSNYVGETKSFTINSEDPIIFEILRNKLYSDPVGAVLREISTNARDANVEAGNGDVPIQIVLPTKSYPYLVIKDNGPGISNERMSKFYSSYGSSTKRDTNTQDGAFGLGSKTPFCLTDQYLISSNIDGFRYDYTCYIDESGKGAINYESPVQTSEPNGTSIKIPVKPELFTECRDKALHYTKFWKVPPVFPGLFDKGQNMPKVLLAGDRWVIYDVDIRSRVLLNGIPYEVSDSMFIGKDSSNYRYSYSYSNYYNEYPKGFCFILNTGDVPISANREKIQEDEKTQSLLTAIFEDFKAKYKKEHIDKIDSLDIVNALEYYSCMAGDYFFTKNFGEMVYKGKKIPAKDNYYHLSVSSDRAYHDEADIYSVANLVKRSKTIIVEADDKPNPGLKGKISKYAKANKITDAAIIISKSTIGELLINHLANGGDTSKIIDLRATAKLSVPKTKVTKKNAIYYYHNWSGRANYLDLDKITSTKKFVYLPYQNTRVSCPAEIQSLGYELIWLKPTYIGMISSNSQFITLEEFVKVWHKKVLSEAKALDLFQRNLEFSSVQNHTVLKSKLKIINSTISLKLHSILQSLSGENSKIEFMNFVANNVLDSPFRKLIQITKSTTNTIQKEIIKEIEKYPIINELSTYQLSYPSVELKKELDLYIGLKKAKENNQLPVNFWNFLVKH